jgi:hypothetical protein
LTPNKPDPLDAKNPRWRAKRQNPQSSSPGLTLSSSKYTPLFDDHSSTEVSIDYLLSTSTQHETRPRLKCAPAATSLVFSEDLNLNSEHLNINQAALSPLHLLLALKRFRNGPSQSRIVSSSPASSTSFQRSLHSFFT